MITDREITLLGSNLTLIIISTVFLSILTGCLAGIYPALVMSGYKPVKALRSNFLKTGQKGTFRKVLVTSQFAVSITLLIVMAFIYRQVHFMIDKDLGFQPDQVMTIPLNEGSAHRRVEAFKSRFKQIPGVQEVTTASSFPGYFLPDWNMLLEGRSEPVTPWIMFGDADLAKTLDIKMVEGRFMDSQFAADSINNFVVNEEFVRRFQIEHPIGQKLKWSDADSYGQIIGVMQDFHYRDLTEEIDPLVMNANHWRSYAGIKLSTDNLPATIAAIQSVWSEIEPNFPMQYEFLDDEFAELYSDHQRFGSSLLYATLLTLFIALLGLFGLTAFTVQRRMREISIRKVLGASVPSIIHLIVNDFMKLLGLAFVISVPVAYLLSEQWLSDFAHRTNLVWWIFAAAGLVILLIAFITVSLQSIRAAWANPIESLHQE